ncbi:stealth conserved region 3 domain-containing protein [Saxibacter everestensis]|uniref:Stealth conserved region 3 domain-containing protein n=1 Tax=Saxibacter everestensis TaxID=2909229 RepID=A0ABY8QTG1_9MICO|nr:stealth conserved region 3 domain-containing protein [Brevibacteriaceae bacterium ZFBP1038]
MAKRVIKSAIRTSYKTGEQLVAFAAAARRPELLRHSRQYHQHRIPHERVFEPTFRGQRQKVFDFLVGCLERSELSWCIVPDRVNLPPRIAVVGSPARLWRLLQAESAVPPQLVAQSLVSPNTFSRLSLRVFGSRAQMATGEVLGPPSLIAHDPPEGERLRFAIYASDASDQAHVGPEAGVDIEFRTTHDAEFDRGDKLGRLVPVLSHSARTEELVDFDVDIVYTWVDDADPDWRMSLENATIDTEALTEAATSEARFRNLDELRYSLRSVAEYADWVRHIWVVTAGQRPEWLRNSERLTVVDHKEIFPDPGVLPTFNSQAIEACLHRIPGLADHFLYLNDDCFLGRPVSPEQFFTPSGASRVFLSNRGLGEGESSPDELAPDSAGKNGRDLVRKLTGQTISHKYLHAPYALQKPVMQELEDAAPDVIAATRASTFRRSTDVTLSGALHHAYALATGRAERSRVTYKYVDLDRGSWRRELAHLIETRAFDTICLNSVHSAAPAAPVLTFLQSYFPKTREFER